jgi:hypothetical protein
MKITISDAIKQKKWMFFPSNMYEFIYSVQGDEVFMYRYDTSTNIFYHSSAHISNFHPKREVEQIDPDHHDLMKALFTSLGREE